MFQLAFKIPLIPKILVIPFCIGCRHEGEKLWTKRGIVEGTRSPDAERDYWDFGD
jgi:hypothetical protein